MKPFFLTDSAKHLSGNFPQPQTVRDVLGLFNRDEKLGFLRLWVSEGIPFAFSNVPLLYEAMRGYVSRRLLVPPKVLTMIGSARLGYSLSPLPDFGKAFGNHSDLDLSLVHEDVFRRLERDFNAWKGDWESGATKPRNKAEERYWTENVRRLPINMSRGFVDPYKIPLHQQYATAQLIGEVLFVALRKLQITVGAPPVSKISLRVYRTWDALLLQMELNLHSTLISFVKASPHPIQ